MGPNTAQSDFVRYVYTCSLLLKGVFWSLDHHYSLLQIPQYLKDSYLADVHCCFQWLRQCQNVKVRAKNCGKQNNVSNTDFQNYANLHN